MMRITKPILAAGTLAIIFGGIALAASLNVWKTESSKEPARFVRGDYAGLPNPADIRGSYTWLDLERVFGIDAAESAAAFAPPGLSLGTADRVSVLETAYAGLLQADVEVGTDSVRLFVALLTGLPHVPEEGTALPPGAVAYLQERGKIDGDGIARWSVQAAASGTPAATVDQAPVAASAEPAAAASPAAPAPAPATTVAPAAATEHSSADRVVTGSTTFGELYAWGVSEKAVADAVGFTPKNRTDSVRNAVSAEGGSFGTVKTKLQSLVDGAR